MSAVAQMFSPRYCHPDQVACLENVSALSSALAKQKKSAEKRMKKQEQGTKSVAGMASRIVKGGNE